MKFTEACGMVYSRGLENFHNKEINKKEFMPQEAFSSCMGRGKALAEEAVERVNNFRALCIAIHRRKKHEKENTTTKFELVEEETKLLSVMPEEDIELAGTLGFWLNKSNDSSSDNPTGDI